MINSVKKKKKNIAKKSVSLKNEFEDASIIRDFLFASTESMQWINLSLCKEKKRKKDLNYKDRILMGFGFQLCKTSSNLMDHITCLMY